MTAAHHSLQLAKAAGLAAEEKLAEKVGLSLPTTSQHLRKLRLTGIVSATREGRHSYYTVEDPHVVQLVEQIFEHIAPDGSLAPDPPRKDHP